MKLGGQRWRAYLPLLVVAGAYLFLTSLYSAVIPAFEGEDEPWHFIYVKALADGQGLPVQPSIGPYQWRQEGSQPPLYYALTALSMVGIDTGPPQKIFRQNPFATIGVPGVQGNKSLVLHSPQEAFPYQGPYLALHRTRFVSVLLGLVTVVFTYFLALAIIPRGLVAAVAASLVAFNPRFLFVSATVNNDSLVVALATIVLWLLACLVKDGLTFRKTAWLGILLGLAALAKLSGLALLPLSLLALGYASWGRPSASSGHRPEVEQRHQSPLWLWLRASALVVTLALVVAGWWYLRNYLLYDDPTGLAAMLELSGPRPPGTALDPLHELRNVMGSYWLVFDWSAAGLGLVHWLVALLAVLSLAGLGWVLGGRRKATVRISRPGLAVLAIWLGISIVSLWQWTQLTPGSAGRLLFPAGSAVALFLAWGLVAVFPRRWRVRSLSVLGLTAFGLALATPFLFVASAYPGPVLLNKAEEYSLGKPTYVNYGDKAELVGYELSTQEVPPGESLELTLYLRALAEMDRDFALYIHLFGQDGEKVAQLDSWPGSGAYPTSLWRPGDLLQDRYRLTVSPEAAAPSALWAEVGFYDPATGERLSPRDAQGREVSPRIARLKLAPSQTPSYQPKETRKIDFGDSVELLGYDLEGEPLRPGGSIAVTLYWKALKSLDADYTVFVQLYQPGSRPTPWAQEDIQPRRGNYPTSLWSAEEVVRDEHRLSLPSEAPAGEYLLLAGLYRADGRESLQVADGERYAILDRIWVEPW